MNDKSIAWRDYLPSAVLIAILAVLLIVNLRAELVRSVFRASSNEW